MRLARAFDIAFNWYTYRTDSKVSQQFMCSVNSPLRRTAMGLQAVSLGHSGLVGHFAHTSVRSVWIAALAAATAAAAAAAYAAAGVTHNDTAVAAVAATLMMLLLSWPF